MTSLSLSLSCIGEGNGSPLQCSCLENPRDGGAWWAAVYGVAQSRTQLKRLSSSSSTRFTIPIICLLQNIDRLANFLLFKFHSDVKQMKDYINYLKRRKFKIIIIKK